MAVRITPVCGIRAEMHGIRNRDDTGYMRRVVPGYERRQPHW
jgi:hypothetical protein